jgi:hypothetical protein
VKTEKSDLPNDEKKSDNQNRPKRGPKEKEMEGPGRGCLAGLISWKLGGGLISTIIIFVIAYALLGQVHC